MITNISKISPIASAISLYHQNFRRYRNIKNLSLSNVLYIIKYDPQHIENITDCFRNIAISPNFSTISKYQKRCEEFQGAMNVCFTLP